MSSEQFDKDYFKSGFIKKIKKLMPEETDEIYENLCMFASQSLEKIMENKTTMADLDKQFESFFSEEERDIREQLIRWLKDFLEQQKNKGRKKQVKEDSQKRRRSSDHQDQNKVDETIYDQIQTLHQEPQQENDNYSMKNNVQKKIVINRGGTGIMDRIKLQPKKSNPNVFNKQGLQTQNSQKQQIKRPQGNSSVQLTQQQLTQQQPQQRKKFINQQGKPQRPVQQNTQQQGQANPRVAQKFQQKQEQQQQQQQQQQQGLEKQDSTQQQQNGAVSDPKSKIKCRFYPNCKDQANCPFNHPTEECEFFPSCKYGQQCKNKHPQCKYGAMCARPDCFYEHPPGRKNMMFNPMMMMPQPYPKMSKPFVRKATTPGAPGAKPAGTAAAKPAQNSTASAANGGAKPAVAAAAVPQKKASQEVAAQ